VQILSAGSAPSDRAYRASKIEGIRGEDTASGNKLNYEVLICRDDVRRRRAAATVPLRA
jgi:hypothetical protein